MKPFPNSKTKGFHSWFPKASKKLTAEYHTSSLQIFPRMILFNSITGEHVLLQFQTAREHVLLWYCWIESCFFMRVHLEFSEDWRKVPRNWDFSQFIKKHWVNRQKKNSQIQIWPIYIIGSFRIPYFGIITCNSNSACICTLALVDDPSHANFCSMFVC